MQKLSLAMRNSGEEGTSLPSVFQSLDKLGAKFRRGQMSMIAAGPGTGKSAIATFLAINMRYGEYDEIPIPMLYFSADMDKGSLGNRIAASVTRFTTQEAEKLLAERNQSMWQMLDDATNNIWFDWNRGLTLDDIEAETEAFAHVLGDWPHIIFVDNLKNVWTETPGDGGDHVRYDRVLDYLHELAGITGAHVCVLHHVGGFYEDGNQPIPLSGILGKVSKHFRLVLTMFRAGEGVLGVSIVKNSNARMDPSGRLYVTLQADLERMQFSDMEYSNA